MMGANKGSVDAQIDESLIRVTLPTESLASPMYQLLMLLTSAAYLTSNSSKRLQIQSAKALIVFKISATPVF